MGLWGTSLSGGHVLVLAAELSEQGGHAPGAVGGGIKAVVSQSPHLDGRLNRKTNLRCEGSGKSPMTSFFLMEL